MISSRANAARCGATSSPRTGPGSAPARLAPISQSQNSPQNRERDGAFLESWALLALSDSEAAAVAKYARSAWDNDKLKPADMTPVPEADARATDAAEMSADAVHANRNKLQ
jgi:mono/diheme cytochrome c family protein